MRGPSQERAALGSATSVGFSRGAMLARLLWTKDSLYSLEVPQTDGSEFWMSIANVLDHNLAHLLGPSVDALGLKRRCFGNGNDFGCSIDGSRRRVDESSRSSALHAPEEVDETADIDIVVAVERTEEEHVSQWMSRCPAAPVDSTHSIGISPDSPTALRAATRMVA